MVSLYFIFASQASKPFLLHDSHQIIIGRLIVLSKKLSST